MLREELVTIFNAFRPFSKLLRDFHISHANGMLGGNESALLQISLESIWAVVGSLETPTNESAPESTPDLWAIEAGQVPTADMSPTNTVPSVISSEVDIRSCLQFLMDLYSAWLHVDNSPKPCLMLINSVVKSVRTESLAR